MSLLPWRRHTTCLYYPEEGTQHVSITLKKAHNMSLLPWRRDTTCLYYPEEDTQHVSITLKKAHNMSLLPWRRRTTCLCYPEEGTQHVSITLKKAYNMSLLPWRRHTTCLCYPEEGTQHVSVTLKKAYNMSLLPWRRHTTCLYYPEEGTQHVQTYLLPTNPPLRKAHKTLKGDGGGDVYKILATRSYEVSYRNRSQASISAGRFAVPCTRTSRYGLGEVRTEILVVGDTWRDGSIFFVPLVKLIFYCTCSVSNKYHTVIEWAR